MHYLHAFALVTLCSATGMQLSWDTRPNAPINIANGDHKAVLDAMPAQADMDNHDARDAEHYDAPPLYRHLTSRKPATSESIVDITQTPTDKKNFNQRTTSSDIAPPAPGDWMCITLTQPLGEHNSRYSCIPQEEFARWYDSTLKASKRYVRLLIGVAVVAALLVPTLCAVAVLAYVTERKRKQLRRERAVDVNELADKDAIFDESTGIYVLNSQR